MTNIRVDIPLLRAQAQQMSEAAAELSAIANRLLSATANAPSYDGQFGPRVAALGPEAHAHLQQLANELAEEAEQLRAKADAFDAADQKARANLLGLLGQMDALLMGFPLLNAYARRQAFTAADFERYLHLGSGTATPGDKPWWEVMWENVTGFFGLGRSTNPYYTPISRQELPPPGVTITNPQTQTSPNTSAPTQIAPTQSPTQVAPTQTPEATAAPTGPTMYVTGPLVNLRSEPSTTSATTTVLARLAAGTAVQVLGPTEQRDGYTWYKVTVNGDTGWLAGEFLSETALAAGSSSPVVDNSATSGGETPVIVNGASTAYGHSWYVAPKKNTDGSYDDHFGVDVSSTTGDSNIYAPYAGEVVAANACDACTTDDPIQGNAPGHTNNIDYNYGYGAMAVMEYPYASMSKEQVEALQADGIELKEGQSLYVMSAHLDPGNVPASGTTLNAGDTVAVIGNSGNSYGAHLHIEVVINDSGLKPGANEATIDFWQETIVERVWRSDIAAERRGNRIDPTPLFDLGE